METFERSQSENLKLMEMMFLRNRLSEIHEQSGPNSSKYIDLKIQLNLLEKEYIDEKINTFKRKKTCFFLTNAPRSFEK
ncbi:hypothetical protein [Niallia sp. Krafla_26]|uniref:hypothetical protein n=1 Tax=Niallia sp. Krafla_26 TaxID=3064703 RepID=UPI003D180C06